MATKPRRNRLKNDLGTIRTVLTAVYIEQDGEESGFIEQFIGVTARGRTLAETRARLENAAHIYLEVNIVDLMQRFEAVTSRRETFTVDVETHPR